MTATIGVLAVQGDVREHRTKLEELGADVIEVRLPEQLDGLDGLVLPGGESTAMARLIDLYGLFGPLSSFDGAILGTCAGMILLAEGVLDGNPAQRTLGLLDVAVRRNGYGRQVQSFEAQVELTDGSDPLPGVFIRAPRIERVGDGVDVLGVLNDEPVLVRQGSVLAAACHPELTDDNRVHRRLIDLALTSRDEHLATA